MRWHVGLGLLGLLLGSGAAPLVAAGALPGPRPISEAERAGVELALGYLERGPAAWWEALSADSPLRALGREPALAELEILAGPPQDAVWRLVTPLGGAEATEAHFRIEFPSGLDESLTLELVPDGERWALQEVRSWVAPVAKASLVAPSSTRAAASDPEVAPSPPRTGLSPGATWLARGGLLVALLGGVGAALSFRRPRLALALLGVGAAGGLTAAGALLGWGPAATAAAPKAARSAQPAVDRTALLAQRRALARTGTFPGAPSGSLATTWQAQALLQQGELAAVDAALARLPAAETSALAEVVRARLGLLRGDAVESALGYERARAILGEIDALLLEEAQALVLSGFEERARESYRHVAEAGTRAAEGYFTRARLAVIESDTERALAAFQQGRRLAPLERVDLLSDVLYNYLLREGQLHAELRLDEPEDVAPLVPGLSARPLALPAGFTATASGELVLFERGRTQLWLPAAAALAPVGTAVESAAARRRRQETQVLAELPALAQAARAPGALSQPVLRARLELASTALARQERWPELLQLTEAFGNEAARLPGWLGRMRAEGLRRANRLPEATQLLVQLARENRERQIQDPGALYQLGHLLAEVGQYDLAMRVVQRAEDASPEPPTVSQIPKLLMEKKLASSFETFTSRHFRLRYPAETTDKRFVTRLSKVLEAELVRLQRFIPYRPAEPIEVHLFPFRDFLRLYSGGGLAIGLFDGKVRMPFADIPSLHPQIVAIFSHEVAHALIAGYTGDRAPSWFHEGLAQHVQMVQEGINPIPDYRQRGSLVTLGLLEPILRAKSDPELLGVAYDETAWALHYIAERHGEAGIRRLLEAFKRGLSTEEALGQALGLTISEFDRRFWAWAEEPAQRYRSTEIVRYDWEIAE